MTDCTCKALGSRLRNIENPIGGIPATRTVVYFDIIDWVPNGDNYIFVIPQTVHTRGRYPQVDVEEDIGGSFDDISLEWDIDALGDTTLMVVRNPDGRFKGRAVFI